MEITSNGVLPTSILTKDEVPPRSTGPPTRQELKELYPAKFSTWEDLKTFVNSGDLGLLKRHRELEKRYDAWIADTVQTYGSVTNYLLKHRLRWGQPDSDTLKSDLVHNGVAEPHESLSHTDITIPISSVIPPYFSLETPSQFISVIENIPIEVEHTLVWTKMPIYHPDLIADTIKTRIDQDGLWGFTGSDLPPPSPSNLPLCIFKLAEWGITMDNMIKSEPPTEEEMTLIQRAGKEVHRYVKNRWIETEWETAWFVNPPRLQSVPAHIHVFARRK